MLRTHHWFMLVLPLYGAAYGCGGVDEPDSIGAPCHGLKLTLLDAAVAPPANVAGLVRVTDCGSEPLGVRLSSHHFELTENGRALATYEGQHIVKLAERQTSARTVIVLDLSGSIVQAGLRDLMIDGAAKLVTQLPPNHRVAVFGFDGRPDLVRFSGFTADRLEIGDALELARQAEVIDDSTNVHGAIVNALRVLDNAVEREDSEVVTHGALVLFTDGDDRAARVSWADADRALDDTTHSTFAIGVGPEIDPARLDELGRSGAVYAGAASEVVAAFEQVGQTLRAHAESTYIVSHCSPARAGRHSLEIAVKIDNRVGRAKIPFDADGFGGGCRPEDAPID